MGGSEQLELADLLKVQEFVDDDLASCFLWAAGEKAMDSAKGLSGDGGGGLKDDPYGLLAGLESAGGGINLDLELGGGGADAHADASAGGEGKKDAKVQLRMARKAQAARDARRRHKSYVQGLEDDVAQMQARIDAAKAKLAHKRALAGSGAAAAPTLPAAEAAPPTSESERASQLSAMETLLRRRSVEQLQPETNALIEKYVGSKRQRETVMLGYLDIIEEILEPSALVTLAFSKGVTEPPAAPAAADAGAAANGGADGSDAAAAAAAAGGGAAPEAQQPAAAAAADATDSSSARVRRPSVGSHMLDVIAAELSLSPPQLEALAQHRAHVHGDREILVTCAKLVEELRAKVEEHLQNQHVVLNGLRTILNPTQVAKYVCWVEKSKQQYTQAADGH